MRGSIGKKSGAPLYRSTRLVRGAHWRCPFIRHAALRSGILHSAGQGFKRDLVDIEQRLRARRSTRDATVL